MSRHLPDIIKYRIKCPKYFAWETPNVEKMTFAWNNLISTETPTGHTEQEGTPGGREGIPAGRAHREGTPAGHAGQEGTPAGRTRREGTPGGHTGREGTPVSSSMSIHQNYEELNTYS